MFDVLLQNGSIIDGTGAEPFPGSVGITDGKVDAVGDLDDAEAKQTLDCSGRVIAPGFIDLHSHSDWVVPLPEHGEVLAPMLEQGVTTLVCGNCGCSPAPNLEVNEWLLPHLGGPLYDKPFEFSWRSMGEFLGHLETQGLSMNVAQFVGHGALRSVAKGADSSVANEAEIREMADLAREALDQGAIGISTGLGYFPGIFARLEELVGVTEPLKERGGVYASHARSYSALHRKTDETKTPVNLLALEETAEIFRAHQVPVQHSHMIFVGDRSWSSCDRVMGRFDDMIDEGIDIATDVFPYVGGNTTLMVFVPKWATGKLGEIRADLEFRARVVQSVDQMCERIGMIWADVQILWTSDRSRTEYEGTTVAEIAKDRGRGGTETYLDLVAELGADSRIICWNYSGRDDDESTLRKVLSHKHTCFETDSILTGEGFENPASYGNFPRVLGRYVRDLKLFDLPEAIRRMTGFAADRMGLKDRGRLLKGRPADVVVFDPDTIADNTTRKHTDARPTGIEHVLVNGKHVVRDGRADTAARAGQVIRRGASV